MTDMQLDNNYPALKNAFTGSSLLNNDQITNEHLLKSLSLKQKEVLAQTLSQLISRTESSQARKKGQDLLFQIFFETPVPISQIHPDYLKISLPLRLRPEWIIAGYTGQASLNETIQPLLAKGRNVPLNQFFHLIPGTNKVLYRITDKGQKSVLDHSLEFWGDGHWYSAHGFKILQENSSMTLPEKLYLQILRDCGLLNSLLPEQNRLGAITVEDLPESSEAFFWQHDRRLTVASGCLYYGAEAFATTCWHETAHAYGQYLQTNKAYWSKLETLFQKATAVFPVFDESNYQTIPETWGHPEQNASELFASATLVLHYYPDKFLENLAQLPPAEKNISASIVRLILSGFPSARQAEIFDHKLISLDTK